MRAAILRSQNNFVAAVIDGNPPRADLRSSDRFSQLAAFLTVSHAYRLRGHGPKRRSPVIRLPQEQRAHDPVVAGDDIDMPYTGRGALYLWQRTQPDHTAFAFVADHPRQLRSHNDIARASDCSRERSIIGRYGRLGIENIERDHLRSRSHD